MTKLTSGTERSTLMAKVIGPFYYFAADWHPIGLWGLLNTTGQSRNGFAVRTFCGREVGSTDAQISPGTEAYMTPFRSHRTFILYSLSLPAAVADRSSNGRRLTASSSCCC